MEDEKKMMTECDYCGKKTRNDNENSDYNHVFCNKECESRYYDEQDRTKNQKEKQILEHIQKNDGTTRNNISKILDMNKYTTKDYLDELRNEDKIILVDKKSWSPIYKIKHNSINYIEDDKI